MSMSKPSFKDLKTINVIQGDYSVSSHEKVVLTTILGSCVAACLYDPIAKIGGMNHFLLPGERVPGSASQSYGLNAMELLINTMLKRGAERHRFQAKLFGGGRMMQSFSDIGQRNAAFATEFLKVEGIPCVSESLGGDSARRVRFWPATGKAQMRILTDSVDTVRVPKKPVLVKPDVVSDVELF